MPGQTTIRNVSQQTIHTSEYLASPRISYRKGGDISIFRIERLNSETGTVEETLELGGTNLPHQPFIAPIRQQVEKYYYPGGPNKRNAVTQVLGTIEDDVVLNGRFKSTKIYNSQLRDNPLSISEIIRRFVESGDPCKFQLGHWIRYGFIIETMPKYRTNADIEWQIRLMITGESNPVTGIEENSTEITSEQVITADQIQDITAQAEKFEQDIQEKIKKLEGFIPDVTVTEFSISNYLTELLKKSPVGGIIDVGKNIYDSWIDTIKVVDEIEKEINKFVNDINQTSQRISAILLFLEVQRGKIYRIQTRLFSSYQRVTNSFNILVKLESWRSIGTTGSVLNEIQERIKESEDNIRLQQINSIKTTYVVKEGDTWQGISTRFFGVFSRWEEIKNLNPKNNLGDPVKNSVILIPN